ncbi:DUF3500 domain-containing protein [Winogradskya consettensis]|uniref:DUF3500 domain-containing protein n=1 Tax=Winogradskya consettensis TaxID=113560 RepID=A0A919VUK7_9ACTN|nr:DUF3500 domain-containing protein [Actinoplanes consettensis]GIM76392.1 hypothetical protein Aco04nite_50190 [Actinoplanes consettensis]
MRRYVASASGVALAGVLLVGAARLDGAFAAPGAIDPSGQPSAGSSPVVSPGPGTSGRPGGPPSGSPGPGGPGGPSGGPGGGITEVNLNTGGSSPGGANTKAVATATSAFLATLGAAERDKVEYDFTDHKARQTWSNFPATVVPRPGIELSDLSSGQRIALSKVLRVALSPAGDRQNTDIRTADDYLRSISSQGGEEFGSLKDYYIAVYGAPSYVEPFAVQFGGHHLSRNLTYYGNKVSQTPQFVGTEPKSFTYDGRTVEPLAKESTTLFGLVASLTAKQRSAAQITSGTFDDLLMGPGKDSGVFPAAEGMPVTRLKSYQRTLLTAAIKAYAGDLAPAAAAKLMAKYNAELDRTRIGWSNNTGTNDEHSYIRVDGPSLWIEIINTRSMSTPDVHYHSVYRDKTNDYGSSRPS